MMKTRTEAVAALDRIEEGARATDLESPTLDFKQAAKDDDDTLRLLASEAICLANGQGGTLVVGVADKVGGADAFLGTPLLAEVVRTRVHQLSRPGLLVDVEAVTRGDKRILLIHVPRGIDVYSDPKGRAPRRIGTDCVPMTPTEQAMLVDERRGFDWSAEPTDAAAKDASELALATARALLVKHPDPARRGYARLGNRELLSALGVIDGKGRMLRAGEILFRPTPGHSILYQFRKTPGGEPSAIERLETPLVLALVRCLELIQARRNVTPVSLPGGQQLPVEDYPELAVREGLVNALVHRDLRNVAPVVVDHSPEIMVIESPGPLVTGVTPENILTHPSRPRNPALARAVRLLGFAEEVGRGVDRMFREMIRAGRRKLPQIEGMPDRVRVTLFGGVPDGRVARFVAQLPDDEREDTDTLLVLFVFLQRATADAAVLSRLLQKSEEETETILRRLASDEISLVEPTRATSGRSRRKYRLRGEALRALGPALPYQRRTVDDIDRKVVAHVREYGKITNRTVQNLLDVSLIKARDILSDLVGREVLIKTSERQRGPGIEYGPGRRFPVHRGR